MNVTKEKKLVKRFKFFTRPDQHDLPIDAYGFECDNGWFDLIWRLCEHIEPLVDKDFYVVQVKEKFGGLRFYTSGTLNGVVYEYIQDAENEAIHTCESCGKPGKLKKINGWYLTACK